MVNHCTQSLVVGRWLLAKARAKKSIHHQAFSADVGMDSAIRHWMLMADS
jgi:hypothetical protein